MEQITPSIVIFLKYKSKYQKIHLKSQTIQNQNESSIQKKKYKTINEKKKFHRRERRFNRTMALRNDRRNPLKRSKAGGHCLRIDLHLRSGWPSFGKIYFSICCVGSQPFSFSLLGRLRRWENGWAGGLRRLGGRWVDWGS